MASPHPFVSQRRNSDESTHRPAPRASVLRRIQARAASIGPVGEAESGRPCTPQKPAPVTRLGRGECASNRGKSLPKVVHHHQVSFRLAPFDVNEEVLIATHADGRRGLPPNAIADRTDLGRDPGLDIKAHQARWAASCFDVVDCPSRNAPEIGLPRAHHLLLGSTLGGHAEDPLAEAFGEIEGTSRPQRERLPLHKTK